MIFSLPWPKSHIRSAFGRATVLPAGEFSYSKKDSPGFTCDFLLKEKDLSYRQRFIFSGEKLLCVCVVGVDMCL